MTRVLDVGLDHLNGSKSHFKDFKDLRSLLEVHGIDRENREKNRECNQEMIGNNKGQNGETNREILGKIIP